jgi:hypothetical protein
LALDVSIQFHVSAALAPWREPTVTQCIGRVDPAVGLGIATREESVAPAGNRHSVVRPGVQLSYPGSQQHIEAVLPDAPPVAAQMALADIRTLTVVCSDPLMGG